MGKNEWISVEDRLPEEPMQNIIVANKLGKVCVAIYSLEEEMFYIMCGKNNTFGVTHWMPMPEPPEV